MNRSRPVANRLAAQANRVILSLPEPPARIAMFAQRMLGGVGRRRISNFANRVRLARANGIDQDQRVFAFGDPSTVLRRRCLRQSSEISVRLGGSGWHHGVIDGGSVEALYHEEIYHLAITTGLTQVVTASDLDTLVVSKGPRE